MTTADQVTAMPAPTSGRLIAGAAFAVPPVALAVVGFGLALRGGGVAAEQWQPAAVGIVISLLVLAAVGATPALPRAAWIPLGYFGGLIVWGAASLAWSASREATTENVVRLTMLAAAMTVGAAYAARPRAALTLAAALAVLGGVVAMVVEVRLLAGNTNTFAGTRLSWPIHYANGAAALLWLPLPPLLAFAAAKPLRPLSRAPLGVLAALALGLGIATESRGAAIALAIALAGTLAIAHDRGRLALTLLAVTLPVAAFGGQLVSGDPSTSAGAAHERGLAALTAALAAGFLVGGLAMLDRRRRFPFGGREGAIALALWTAAAVVALAVFTSSVGRPDTWLRARWDEFATVHPSATADVSHFGTGVSNRYDYWRVGWLTFREHPVEGVGSGAFSVPWYRERALDESVSDAHSWEANALAEGGIVGLALTALVLLLPLGRIRSARSARGVWPIAAVALGGAGVYFVAHASLDWLFRIPAIAIPGFLVLGALATGGMAPRLALASGRQRAFLAGASVAAAIAVIPVYASTAQVGRAESAAATSSARALDRLDWAERLNPFSVEPLVVRAGLLEGSGAPAAALDAAREATERGPQNWVAWAALAQARRAAGDAAGARIALRHMTILNPRGAALGIGQ